MSYLLMQNLSEGHGKSWKSNMLSENRKAKRQNKIEKTDKLEASFNFSRNRHKHISCAFFTLENMLNE